MAIAGAVLDGDAAMSARMWQLRLVDSVQTHGSIRGQDPVEGLLLRGGGGDTNAQSRHQSSQSNPAGLCWSMPHSRCTESMAEGLSWPLPDFDGILRGVRSVPLASRARCP